MLKKLDRKAIRKRIKERYRDKMHGSKDRPRLSVYRSLKHVSIQAFDDETARVICSASTLEKDLRTKLKEKTGNCKASALVGQVMGERLKQKGLTSAVFDRNGFRYHGVVKNLAEAVRSQGIQF